MIQNSDRLLPKALIIGRSPLNKLPFVFLTDNVIAVIAKIYIAATLNLEFIQVVLHPAEDLEHYPCKLFESCLVCDLKISIPIGEYEFGITRIPASILHVEFEDSWDTPFPLRRFLFDLDQLCKLCVTGRHGRLQNVRICACQREVVMK